MISGEVPDSLIELFQEVDDEFRKVWIYVVSTKLVSVKQDLMHRAFLIDLIGSRICNSAVPSPLYLHCLV